MLFFKLTTQEDNQLSVNVLSLDLLIKINTATVLHMQGHSFLVKESFEFISEKLQKIKLPMVPLTMVDETGEAPMLVNGMRLEGMEAIPGYGSYIYGAAGMRINVKETIEEIQNKTKAVMSGQTESGLVLPGR